MPSLESETLLNTVDGRVSLTERFTSLFLHMREGVALHELVYDADGTPIDYRILDLNPQFEAHTGLRRENIIGKLASEAYGMGHAPYLAEYSAVALGGAGCTLEVHFEPLGRYFSISVAPLGRGAFATIFFDITETKLQTRAIENSRMCLRALLDNLPHQAWLKDDAGRYLAVNRAFATAYGVSSPDDLVGKSDLDLAPHERATSIRNDDAEVMKHGPRKYVEEETSDAGGVRWLEVHKSPLIASDGSISGTTGIARDITAQRRAEAAAEAARQELAQYFEFSLDLMCIAKTDGQFTRLNPAWERVLGYPVSQLEGSNFLDLVHPDDLEGTIQATSQLRRGQQIPDFCNRYRHADGSWRWLEWHSAPDERGYIYAVARDVTERHTVELALRAAEQKVARSRAQLLSVAEMAHIGHFSIHFDRDTVDWTPELYRICCFDPNSRVPTIETTRACFHPDDLPKLDAAMHAAIDDGTAARLQLRILRPSGDTRHCLTIIEADNDTAEKPVVLGLVQDLTELKRAEDERLRLEQQVMQSQKLESLGVLAGGIAHDFNNLLTSILGNADLALSELSPVNPARVYLDDIEQVSRRAADLCRQMLAYSGKGKFVVQSLSLNEVVREMAYLLGVSISKKVIIKYNFFEGLPSVMADATQLRQIVMNLITNASEAIAEANGIVTLTTGVMDCDDGYLSSVVGDNDQHACGQYVYLEVSDTGCGMDAETISRIFDPFFTTKFTGRGLGLAAVMGIVRGHKGALRVYSEKGHGTTFKVLFPAYPHPAQTLEQEDRSTLDWRGHGLVLLVDDEDSILNMSRHMLERAGFDVITASNGREAVEVFGQRYQEVRIVILDMTMPHLDGEACFRELRRICPTVKVIMTSGYNEQDVINRFVGKGLAGFVQKPYKASDLLPKLRAALGED